MSDTEQAQAVLAALDRLLHRDRIDEAQAAMRAKLVDSLFRPSPLMERLRRE